MAASARQDAAGTKALNAWSRSHHATSRGSCQSSVQTSYMCKPHTWKSGRRCPCSVDLSHQEFVKCSATTILKQRSNSIAQSTCRTWPYEAASTGCIDSDSCTAFAPVSAPADNLPRGRRSAPDHRRSAWRSRRSAGGMPWWFDQTDKLLFGPQLRGTFSYIAVDGSGSRRRRGSAKSGSDQSVLHNDRSAEDLLGRNS